MVCADLCWLLSRENFNCDKICHRWLSMNCLFIYFLCLFSLVSKRSPHVIVFFFVCLLSHTQTGILKIDLTQAQTQKIKTTNGWWQTCAIVFNKTRREEPTMVEKIIKGGSWTHIFFDPSSSSIASNKSNSQRSFPLFSPLFSPLSLSLSFVSYRTCIPFIYFFHFHLLLLHTF